MSYLGLAPSEHSSGGRRRQGAITKTGNGRARRTLVESAWSYRFQARISVWYEIHDTMESAIQREKTIKNWKRAWRIKVIEKMNPGWHDVYPDLHITR